MTLQSFSGNLIGLEKSIPPFFSINFEDEDEFFTWVKEAFDVLKEPHRERTMRDQVHRDFYMGLQSYYQSRDKAPRDKEGRPLEKFSRVTINQCYELIEQWVSKMTRFAPAIAVLPASQEHNDRIAAKLSKEFIDYLFYINDVDDDLEAIARNCRIDGETYYFITWNKDKGDYVPGYKELEGYGVRVPLLDSEGNQILNEKQEPMFVEKGQRVGDVDYEVVERKYILLQPKIKYKDVEWLYKISSKSIDELKADYPDKAHEIEEKGRAGNSFDFDTFEADADWKEVLVFDFYHKSTKFVDKGRHIKFIDGVMLENQELPYSHGELPCARLTNIDVPGILHGVSFLEQIILLQVIYNNTVSIAYTNLSLGAHLYWLVPRQGDVDITKIKNGNSVIKFNGGFAPQLQQFKTIGEEIFKTLDFIDKAISRISAIQDVSRGEIPTGVEAGVAMAFLEEQENQRANTDIKKHNAFIKKTARMSLSVAGDFYKPEDGRMIRIVGKNNQFAIKALDIAKLGGAHDIRVQRTTALSESKSGRLSQILALQGRFPDKLPWEQVADMLDLANDEKFYSIATVAVQAAERENELMAEGTQVAPPESWEELLVHWYSHAKFVQSASFKEDMDDAQKQLFLDHLQGTEYLIWKKLEQPTNIMFKQKVFALENFPLVTLVPLASEPTAPPGAPGAKMPPPGDQSQPNGSPTDNNDSPEPTDSGEPPSAPEPMPLTPPTAGTTGETAVQ